MWGGEREETKGAGRRERREKGKEKVVRSPRLEAGLGAEGAAGGDPSVAGVVHFGLLATQYDVSAVVPQSSTHKVAGGWTTQRVVLPVDCCPIPRVQSV